LNKRLVGSIPPELGVSRLNAGAPDAPLSFGHWSPPEENALLRSSRKDILPLRFPENGLKQTEVVSPGSDKICHL